MVGRRSELFEDKNILGKQIYLAKNILVRHIYLAKTILVTSWWQWEVKGCGKGRLSECAASLVQGPVCNHHHHLQYHNRCHHHHYCHRNHVAKDSWECAASLGREPVCNHHQHHHLHYHHHHHCYHHPAEFASYLTVLVFRILNFNFFTCFPFLNKLWTNSNHGQGRPGFWAFGH